ncbi:MAG: VWA domain-containing protein [Alistipes sp.]|nr:VWA domain-containing protein [Alistipes sp.]
MFQFASPAWLWLLLAVVLLPLLYWVLRFYARRKVRRLGNVRTLTALMPDSSPARGWIKIALLSLAVGFMALALARPQMGSKLRSTETEGREIVLVVDVSNSMLADDVSPSRMERTRYAIARLLESMKEDRVGVVAFADEAEVLLPITGDYKMARSMVKRLSPTLIARQGTDIGNALDVALLSFTESTHNKNSRVIILITDGEAHDADTDAAIARAKAEGVMVCAIGIGTPEGVPLSINGTIMEDEDGKMVVTKLGEALLQQIADETGGMYMRSRNDAFGLDEIVGYLDELEATKLSHITFEEYDEQYQWFLGMALLLLVAEGLVLRRKNPLLRGVTLFERETKTINRKKL